MKKLARLTALLLTCALLLVLTACGAAPGGSASMTLEEIAAKQRLLDEINSYRASIHLDSLDEVDELSAAEQDLINHFRAAGKTVLPESEGDEALDRWESMTVGWDSCGSLGAVWKTDEDNKWIYILDAMVPANTPEGKTELLAALKDCPAFNISNCKSIGIAVVTIDGQMYWTCTMYY